VNSERLTDQRTIGQTGSNSLARVCGNSRNSGLHTCRTRTGLQIPAFVKRHIFLYSYFHVFDAKVRVVNSNQKIKELF
jgi:hypothetical protein